MKGLMVPLLVLLVTGNVIAQQGFNGESPANRPQPADGPANSKPFQIDIDDTAIAGLREGRVLSAAINRDVDGSKIDLNLVEAIQLIKSGTDISRANRLSIEPTGLDNNGTLYFELDDNHLSHLGKEKFNFELPENLRGQVENVVIQYAPPQTREQTPVNSGFDAERQDFIGPRIASREYFDQLRNSGRRDSAVTPETPNRQGDNRYSQDPLPFGRDRQATVQPRERWSTPSEPTGRDEFSGFQRNSRVGPWEPDAERESNRALSPISPEFDTGRSRAPARQQASNFSTQDNLSRQPALEQPIDYRESNNTQRRTDGYPNDRRDTARYSRRDIAPQSTQRDAETAYERELDRRARQLAQRELELAEKQDRIEAMQRIATTPAIQQRTPVGFQGDMGASYGAPPIARQASNPTPSVQPNTPGWSLSIPPARGDGGTPGTGASAGAAGVPNVALGSQAVASFNYLQTALGTDFTQERLERVIALGRQNEDNAKMMQALFFLFLLSTGLCIYLAWISRGFYVRYHELADELRETFTSTM